jgi:hypothetical protein
VRGLGLIDLRHVEHEKTVEMREKRGDDGNIEMLRVEKCGSGYEQMYGKRPRCEL